MCSVLGYLHTQHPPIIYRDLKPANILFTREGHLSLIDLASPRILARLAPQDMPPLSNMVECKPPHKATFIALV